MGAVLLKNKNLQKRRIIVFIVLVLSLFIFDKWLFRTNGWTRLLWGTLSYSFLFASIKISKFSYADLGLSPTHLHNGLMLAVKIIGVYTIGLLIVYFAGKSIFRDPRYHHAILTAIYSALLILPLKTVLFEEFVFRSLIPGFINSWSSETKAIIYSSLLFGLWHLTTALDIRGAAVFKGHQIPAVFILLAVFVATSLAGYVLCILRYKSQSLMTPLAVHWYINASAVLLAAIAWSK